MAQGARCVVIGGSGRLGGAVCRALVGQGARVVLTYHEGVERAEQLVRELGEAAHALRLDLRDPASIDTGMRAACAHLGGVNALVHCAGLGAQPGYVPTEGQHQQVLEITPEDWDALFAVHVRGPFLATHPVVEAMRSQGQGGNLVFVGSIEGVKPVPTPAHYAASKAALSGLARAMGKELGPDQICVNVVAPGVLVDGVSRALPQSTLDEYLKHSALGRFGEFGEIAAMIAYLALHNTYLTGQTVALDGGL